MPDDIAERLGAVRRAQVQGPAPVHDFSIHKFFVESGNDDSRPLRTHPNVLGVFLKVCARVCVGLCGGCSASATHCCCWGGGSGGGARAGVSQ
jgi:hypothetical protein